MEPGIANNYARWRKTLTEKQRRHWGSRKEYLYRVNPEVLLGPVQERRLRGIVRRALEKLGLKPKDLPREAFQDLVGMARAGHPDYPNQPVEYGFKHYQFLVANAERQLRNVEIKPELLPSNTRSGPNHKTVTRWVSFTSQDLPVNRRKAHALINAVVKETDKTFGKGN